MSNKYPYVLRGGAMATLAALLSACAVHAPLKPLPDAQTAGGMASVVTDAPAGEWPREQWWRQLGDEQLSALVEEGLKNNPDMDAAMARIQAAPSTYEPPRTTWA